MNRQKTLPTPERIGGEQARSSAIAAAPFESLRLEKRHQSAANMLAYALKLGPSRDKDLAYVWGGRLTDIECARLLSASIAACDPQVALDLMEAASCDLSSGGPVAPFDGYEEEWRRWSAEASHQELRAAIAPIYAAMHCRDKSMFLEAIGRGGAS